MSSNSTVRRLAYVFLFVTPFLSFTIAAMRPLRIAGLYQTITVVQIILIFLAVWKLGLRAIKSGSGDQRMLALAGGLLIAPWLFFALIPGVGPPWQATEAENQIRYFVLVFGGTAVASGLIVLSETLKGDGERFYSTLGFAATMLAGPFYLLWMIFPLAFDAVAAHELESSGQLPVWLTSIRDLAELVGFSGVVLTYLAVTAFAAGLGRTPWLGKRSSRAFIITSLFAVLCLAVMLVVSLQSPQDPVAIFKTWYTIPGFIFSIPAIPLIMPSLLGAILLSRAGEE